MALSTSLLTPNIPANIRVGMTLGDLTAAELVQRYNKVLSALLDQHCPIVTVRRRVNKKTTPWFDADCRAARRRSRAAERRFKRSLSSTDYSVWSAELHKMKALYEQKTSTYWRNEIATCNGNNRRLWQILQNVLSGSGSVDTGVHTAEDFAAFVRDKVQSVRACTTTTPLHDVQFQGHDIFRH